MNRYVQIVGKILFLVIRLVVSYSKGNDHHSDLICLVAPRQPGQFVRIVGDEESVFCDFRLHF